jgi:phosphoribosylanthranilate isomerase
MWTKICGNTNLEDARLASDGGADAVGFVFAPSPRQVNRETVQQITPHLPRGLETIGVFVDAGFDEIVETVTTCGLSGVQLHRSTDSLLPSRLRESLRNIRIFSVVNYRAESFEQQLIAAELDRSLNGVLVDSSTAKAVGGTGVAYNWIEARRAILRAAPNLRLIAAGGLNPENVKQAIAILEPWGVDVVSGVEKAPGKKDPARVLDFLRSAREAAKEAKQRA